MSRVLVTGGCGFIGSHLVDRLVADGHSVRVLDNLDPQVHAKGRPQYVNPAAEYVEGDVIDDRALEGVLQGSEVIFHFAAAVGVGQSMYEIARYTASNTLGTARLLDHLARNEPGRVEKLVVASSMSVYGEGAYSCPSCEDPIPRRDGTTMSNNQWEPLCERCREPLTSRPTSEDKALEPTSVYALNKLDQEKLCLIVGRAYAIPTVALRFFNVYGPRQSLSNPYTGVAAIFSSRIKDGNPPVIYEDGRQLRDFVSVSDIVAACRLVMHSEEADGRVFNVGSGSAVSVRQIADILLELHGEKGRIEPEISGRFRTGDIRHCYADISALREIGYEPAVELEEGMRELVDWSGAAESEDQFDRARQELERKGLA